MDEAGLIFTKPLTPPSPLERGATGQVSAINGAGRSVGAQAAKEEKTKQLAKDFESLLVGQLLDEMKNTIGESGFGDDVAAGEVKGMFWLLLGREVADKGGLGLWKDLYQFFSRVEQPNAGSQSLDESL